MTQTVSEIIAEAGAKTAKNLKIDEEEPTEQSGEEEGEPTETPEEEPVEEGDATEVEDETPTEPQPKKTTKTVPIERFNEVYSKMKQMERYLEHVAANQQKPQPREEPREEKPEPLPDLEELTNTELFGLLRKTLVKDVKGALTQAVSPLSEFVSSSRQERADQEVASVAAAHSDYFDYAEKMVEVSNRNPNLTAQEVYDLAKGNKGAAQKSVVARMKAKQTLKKKANVEKRSSSVDKIDEKKEFKTVREAGLALAKKMGLT